MKHLLLNGWLNTACGLPNDESRETTSEAGAVSCKNCNSFMDSTLPVRAWNQCKPPSLRRFYLERAGLEPSRVEKIVRVSLWSAITSQEKKKIIRQMQSNPILARLLAMPHNPIESGSALDQRGKYPRFDYFAVIKTNFCRRCGVSL